MLRTLSLTGTVTARRQARLSSRETGLVMEVRVDAGSMVREGDVLMTLDTRLADIALELIRAEIAQGQIELDDARRLENEVRDLVASGGFARSEAESRKSAVRVSEANLLQLQAREREQIEMIERHQLVAPFGGVISREDR
jgi:multidrug efflux pump subunit AcrA (membrane-fusion protein)